MYTRRDITLADRQEIFSRYWRFGDNYGTVSRLAEEFRTSRQFIYEVAGRVKEALDWRPAGRQEVDHQGEEIARLKHRIRELEADCEQLRGQLAVERAKARQDRFRLLLELSRL
jgi:phage shock protein A